MNIDTNTVEEEIDLVIVAKIIWIGRQTIAIAILSCAMIGLFFALLTPKEYTAKTVMLARTGSGLSGSGNIGGLAAMVGISLGSVDEENEISPVDYPEFIKSLSFQQSLMHIPFQWEQFDHELSLYEYYDQYYKPGSLKIIRSYTIGLPQKIIGWIRGLGKNKETESLQKNTFIEKSLDYLSNTELMVRGVLNDKLELTLNQGNNFVTIEATAPEAVASAELARVAQEQLQERITEIKIIKAQQSLDYTQKLLDEKILIFEEAQNHLAQFRDRNLNLGSEQAKTEEERLFGEYQLAFSVYNELAKELETAKIRVEEDTPIFSIIEKVTVPSHESKPNKKMIMLVWSFLGGVIGLVIVLSRRLLGKARKRWGDLNE